MIPDQLVVAVVLHNILKAWHRHQAHALCAQVAVDGLEHDAWVGLVLQEVKGEKYIVGAA